MLDKDLDELLWDKLPDILNDEQKKHRITNLLSELRRENKVVNNGTFANPQWMLS
jgi:ATP-dependent DNA helicase RecG